MKASLKCGRLSAWVRSMSMVTLIFALSAIMFAVGIGDPLAVTGHQTRSNLTRFSARALSASNISNILSAQLSAAQQLAGNVQAPNVSNIQYPALSSGVLETIANETLAIQMGGLEIWVSVARSFRQAIRTTTNVTYATVQVPSQFWTSFDLSLLPTSLRTILTSILGFVGFNLVAAVLTLIISPCLCCCCIYKRKKSGPVRFRKIGKEYTATSLTMIKVLFFALALIELIVVICAVQGNASLSRGIQQGFSAVINLVQALSTLVYKVNPVANALLLSAGSVANSSIDDLTTLDNLNGFMTDLNGNGTILVTSLNQGNVLVGQALGNATLLQSQIGWANGNISTLQSQVASNINAANALNGQLTVPGTGEGYSLNQQITGIPSASSISPPSFNPPDMYTAINQLQSIPNLGTLATTTSTQLNNASTTLNAIISNVNGQIKGTVNQVLSGISSQVSSMTNPTSQSSMIYGVAQQITGVQNVLTTNTPAVANYDAIRYYVHLGIGIVIVCGLLLAALGSATRNPGPPQYMACLYLFLSILLFLLTTIYFIVTLAMAEGCRQLDKTDPMPILATFPGMASVPSYAKVALSTIDYCMNNYSIFSALDKSNATTLLGLTATIPSFNLTTLVNSTLQGFNASGMVNQSFSGLDISSIISVNSSTSQLSTISSSGLSQVNLTYYSSLNTTIDMSSVNNLVTNLINLNSSVSTSSFNYQSSTYTSQQKTNCLNDFKSRLTTLVANLQTMSGSTAPATTTILDAAKATVSKLQPLSTQLITLAPQVITQVQNLIAVITGYLYWTQVTILTQKIPNIINNFVLFAGQVDTVIATQLSCQPVASSIDASKNSVCITMAYGFDAIWMAFFFHALFGLPLVSVLTHLHRALYQLFRAAPDPSKPPPGKILTTTEVGNNAKIEQTALLSPAGQDSARSRAASNAMSTRQSYISQNSQETQKILDDGIRNLKKKGK